MLDKELADIRMTEQPFTQYPALLDLQAINGVDAGGKYKSNQACQRFVEVIYDDIWEPCYNDLKAARFISVLAGAATDVSIRDLEGIYVRFLKDGQPNDMFVAVEELKHATATGHCEAINAGKKVGLNDWKEKTVGFGSDGAAVSVNDVGEWGSVNASAPRDSTTD
ncbi:hypothetical protein SKAU_G00423220 [Synaphobranchus kaupii]|uniref:Uncharacterized protein n=1 Tax=Synaphobranchus kaupii TaxID=118154 RepID=A0A9Q1I8M0_SYNKA|nr:hypothetical protein SKAU_G00423220 [Synaphobranchus kaupii]